MSDFGAPPVIPTELQQYNSYVEDPKWQAKFSYIWAAVVGAAFLASVPHIVQSIRNRRLFRGMITGVTEYSVGKHYQLASGQDAIPTHVKRRVSGVVHTLCSTMLWTLPGVELNLGQMLLVGGYLAIVVASIAMNIDLVTYPNRAGFIALAQFPVVFLFGTKNSIVSLILGPGNGYERLNYIHRWSGRGLFIAATIHGALWIKNHLIWDLPILGQQKETSGVAALGVLCGIVLTSLRPVRRWFYQSFFIVHVLGYVAFFITICYHTTYASPWIFPPLAFYGFDILLRVFRYRIKDATLVPVDTNMTLIHIHDCDDGWLAGQHVRLRVFIGARVFESHPLTILNAPPASSCMPSSTVTLAARAVGDWTREINAYALAEQARLRGEKDANQSATGAQIQVMIDGPYGGCSIDLGQHESVLLVAGGSGAAFTLGLLDDLIARCTRLGRPSGERTRRIEFAWCVRSYGALHWFAPRLEALARACAGTTLDLHVSVYVTCLCAPAEVPFVPNMDVTIVERPSVVDLLRAFVTPPSCAHPNPAKASDKKVEADAESISVESVSDDIEGAPSGRVAVSDRLAWVGLGGGVAVCAAGPESMTREAQNAVARIGLTRGVELGGVALHTELFAM
ncbi:iron reductase [Epithele typhae]|uniref:iron reductase n=1 Tax=Epithele typhae TaxID=378194 RepID=UPI002007ADCF|nr:iron reductase [Epithele typhae]KAH9926613.1 iron reductase [Epithele typhae]